MKDQEHKSSSSKDNKRVSKPPPKHKTVVPQANIYETRKPSNTQAYMLVYIREEEKDKILRQPQLEDLPSHITDFFNKENKVLEEMHHELKIEEECGSVFLISPETANACWMNHDRESMIIPQMLVFNDHFVSDQMQRLKIKMRYSSKV